MKATWVSEKPATFEHLFFIFIKMDFKRDLLFLSSDTQVTSVKKLRSHLKAGEQEGMVSVQAFHYKTTHECMYPLGFL